MKVWKLVSGVISIVFSMFIIAQIVLMGLQLRVLNGPLIAGLMLAAGIVSIVFWKKDSRGCDIVLLILFFLAVFLGACKYIDLNIWAIWCFACGVVTFVRFVKDANPDCKNKSVSESLEAANDATKLVKETEENLGKEQKQAPAEEKKPDKKPRKRTKKKTEKALPEPPDEVQSEEKTE